MININRILCKLSLGLTCGGRIEDGAYRCNKCGYFEWFSKLPCDGVSLGDGNRSGCSGGEDCPVCRGQSKGINHDD